jgi:hypothetical protein
MSSLLAERPAETEPLSGVQTPRIFCWPEFPETSGDEVSDWLAVNGLILDPWQRLVFQKSLQERADGSWAAFEVGLTVGRQNGKTLLLAARAMAGMFLFDEELIVHTAHQWKTAHKSFLLLQKLIRHSPDLMSRVKRFSGMPGMDIVHLKDGRTVEFIARSKASGRGFSADTVIMDEAYDLTSEQMGALMPTLSAMPNPQIWYASSAPMAHSEVLHRLRERAVRDDSPRLCYLEWSAPEGCNPRDPRMWATANPSLGIRISAEFFEVEQASLDPHEFGRECLGWPDAPAGSGVFGPGVWDSLLDPTGPSETPTYALAVADDRSWACVAAAGVNARGVCHVEYGAYHSGTAWVVDWLAELASRRKIRVVVRPSSQAGSLIPELEARRVPLVKASALDYAQACGDFYDSVTDRRDVAHLGQPALDIAVAQAQTRRNADAFTWDQRNPAVDICPLEAVTLAAWGFRFKQARSGRFVTF